MALSTIAEVRELAGCEATYERNIALFGVADGVNTVFYVPQRFIVDSNASETVTIADIVVYDDDVSVAITAVDVDLNKVTLTAAPAAGSVMTCDYAHSNVKESVIAALHVKLDAEILKLARTANVGTAYTQYWDGDGRTAWFQFKRIPVTSLTSYEIDGATTGFTLNTDYWLQPDPVRALWIEFKTAPNTNIQNIKITYQYGETQYLLAQLSKYMCAREVLLYGVGKTAQTSGVYTGSKRENVFSAEQRRLTQVRRMDERIAQLEERLGGQFRVKVH